mgnify:CR=1 FL=1
MLFTGHSEHSIDSKLRLAVPARYRNLWDPARDGGAWVCIPWPTGHLRLYTEATFSRMAEQGEMSLTPDETTAELETSLYGLAERLEMDSAEDLADVFRAADRTAALLPRYASRPERDPRAPQNLLPIGQLERELRHQLGDIELLQRFITRAFETERPEWQN